MSDLIKELNKFIIDNGQNEGTEWMGKLYKGRPYVSYKGKNYSAARALMTEIYGEIPLGMHVMHLCHNRECLNIYHLKIGSPMENYMSEQPDYDPNKEYPMPKHHTVPTHKQEYDKWKKENVKLIRNNRKKG